MERIKIKKCKDCNACEKGFFKWLPNEYVCIGVSEPFVIKNINNLCSEYSFSEEQESHKPEENIEKMQSEYIDLQAYNNLLYSAILAWYDDSIYTYHGLDDKEFIEKVCSKTGMTEKQYAKLMLEK